MSRAVIIKNFDKPFPANIEVATRPIPTPGPDELLVRVTCRPVNPSDVYTVKGKNPGFPAQLPAVPGLEDCGVVQDNNGHAKFENGQRVIVLFDAANGQGSWQEHVCVREDRLIATPDSMSDEVACQFFVNPLTLMGMLHRVNAPQGSYILQTAAASTLGRMLIAVAKHKGLRTVNLVRRDEHIAELKELGGDVVINSTGLKDGELKKMVEAEVGDGVVWAALECIGGSLLAEVMRCVRDKGEVLAFGMMDSIIAHVDYTQLMVRGVVLKGFMFFEYLDSLDPAARSKLFEEVLQLMAEGLMLPNNWKSMPLEEVVQAVNDSTLPGKPGKVLLSS